MAELGTARPSVRWERGPADERSRPNELWPIDISGPAAGGSVRAGPSHRGCRGPRAGYHCPPDDPRFERLRPHADTHFDLYLDGALQRSTVDVENSPSGWVKLNLTNYPAGLSAGRHTFVGVWISDGDVYSVMSARITFTR